MARYNVLTLVNPSSKDFVDKWDGEEYIVPAGGELAVPDFLAHFFCGDNTPEDNRRALDRRGNGSKSSEMVGLPIYIKEYKEAKPVKEETEEKEQFIVDGATPLAKVKTKVKKEK